MKTEETICLYYSYNEQTKKKITISHWTGEKKSVSQFIKKNKWKNKFYTYSEFFIGLKMLTVEGAILIMFFGLQA